MDTPLRYDRDLRRTWVIGLRFHHGMAGAMLAIIALPLRGVGRALLASIGAGLMFHDWRDFPWTHDR